jgi:hypothetical protein
MAMINCPECGKEISSEAKICLNCGCPSKKLSEDKKQNRNWLIATACILAICCGCFFGFRAYEAEQQKRALEAYENSEFHQNLQDLKSRMAESAQTIKEIRANLDKAWEKVENAEEDAEVNRLYMTSLADDLFELAEKDTKTKGDITIMKTYIDALEEAGIKGLSECFDETTGELSLTKGDLSIE